MWGVSQASAEAEGTRNVEYQYLDNSKTGKAGEADLIIGVGRSNDHSPLNTVRNICISKNKQNGWHGTFDTNIDIYRGVYQKIDDAVVIPPEARENLVEESSESDREVDFNA